MVKKKGQMKISFGLIFSVILIIVFILFAFFGIKEFGFIQNDLKKGKLFKDLQSDIDNLWESSKGSNIVSYPVPKGIQALCFREPTSNDEDETYNAVLVPEDLTHIRYVWEDGDGKILNHLNWLGIKMQTVERVRFYTPEFGLCILVENSKVEFVINKDYDETEVTIFRIDADQLQEEGN